MRDRQHQDTMLANPPVAYNFCVGIPILHLLTGTFNQEMVLVGALYMIVQTLLMVGLQL